jgi:hypothetical protein
MIPEVRACSTLSVAIRRYRTIGQIARTPGPCPKGSCLDRGAAEVFNALREEQGRRLLTNVKVVATGCMEACLAGPALLVVPETSGTAGSPRPTSPPWSSST